MADTLGLVAAPGAEILTTAPSERYDFESGSSLAAAHVSGLVAQVLEKRLGLSAREVHLLLRDTARRTG